MIPKGLKLQLRRGLRWMSDRRSGIYKNWAGPNFKPLPLPHSLKLALALNGTEAKLANLKLAMTAIEETYLGPGEVFSFWNRVPAPYQKNGYRPSRSIVKGKVEESIGGGLCQLSGMMYYLSLMAGLEILERYPHSKDIYDDESRYTPLGSDATVVYAYKDLRIRNPYEQALRFEFQIKGELLELHLHSQAPIEPRKVEFKSKALDESLSEVHTFVDGDQVNTDHYPKA